MKKQIGKSVFVQWQCGSWRLMVPGLAAKIPEELVAAIWNSASAGEALKLLDSHLANEVADAIRIRKQFRAAARKLPKGERAFR